MASSGEGVIRSGPEPLAELDDQGAPAEEKADFEPDSSAMSHFDRASMDAAEAMGIEGCT